MKNISENLKGHLAKEVTTLAKFILITCKDGSVIALTSFDKEFQYDGNIYKPYLSSDIFADYSGFSVNKKESILSVIEDDIISKTEVESSKLDSADIEIFLLNYESPEDGKLILKKGFISKIRYDDDKLFIEISGYSSLLKNRISQNFSPNCRAKFGDSKCGINIADHTFSGAVTFTINKMEFIDTARTEEKNYFSKGVITFLSGANSGSIREIANFTEGKFKLLTSLIKDIETGDEYQVSVGCDKNSQTCISKFDNIINFRGEPHIPGTDRILKV